jgi:hypothetical protein
MRSAPKSTRGMCMVQVRSRWTHNAGVPAILIGSGLRVLGLAAHKTKIRFVHRRGRLQSLPRLLGGEFLCREFPQLIVDNWQQLLGSIGIAGFDLGQDLRNVGHRRPSNNHNVHDCSNCDTRLPRLSRGLKRG